MTGEREVVRKRFLIQALWQNKVSELERPDFCGSAVPYPHWFTEHTLSNGYAFT
jgi:hypothetical protein